MTENAIGTMKVAFLHPDPDLRVPMPVEKTVVLEHPALLVRLPISSGKLVFQPHITQNLIPQIDPDVWVYYMVELSFYWSLSIRYFSRIRYM